MIKKSIMFIVVIIFVPIGIFIISNNYFGIILSLSEILSLVFSGIAICISLFIFIRTQRTNTMPVLVFVQKSEKTWLLQNVGVGPALIVLAANNVSQGKCFPILFPPISAGAFIELNIFEKDANHGAVYTDIKGNYYSSLCVKNKNEFFERNKYPEWKPFLTEWQQKKDDAEMRSKIG
jgi:hypothetical protein